MAHGFEILRRLSAAGSGALRLKEGSLYPASYRLERAGLIARAWEADSAPRRGPRKRVYRLTKQGVKRLAAGRAEWHWQHGRNHASGTDPFGGRNLIPGVEAPGRER